MAQGTEEYTVNEAARLLGMSPARVRRMLRSGELEGERREERIAGVLGPWRIPTEAVQAFRERRDAETAKAEEAAEATVVMPPGENLVKKVSESQGEGRGESSGERTSDTPSEASERLSEGVRDLREKAEELLEELQRLEGRLEATEIQEAALREELRQEKERSTTLQTELDAKSSGQQEQPRGAWRRLFGK